jgi:hypothetical protein
MSKPDIIHFIILRFPVSYLNTQRLNYTTSNFDFYVWVRNLVSRPKRKTRNGSIWEEAVDEKFGPGAEEETGGWRKLRHMKRHSLWSSPNITDAIKSKRVIWVENVHIRTHVYWKYQSENMKYKDNLEDLDVDGSII